jgi:hypothetical protein
MRSGRKCDGTPRTAGRCPLAIERPNSEYMYSSGKYAGLARDHATSVRTTALTMTSIVIGAMATRTATARTAKRG